MLEGFSLDTAFSTPRINVYRAVMNCSNDKECLALYLGMMDISSSMLSLLHILETVFRNRLDREIVSLVNTNALPSRKGTSPREWYNSVTFFPHGSYSDNISHRKVLKAVKTALSPDDVISRLDFGYWVYLLDSRHENPLSPSHYIWQPGIQSRVFPNSHGKTIRDFFNDFRKAGDMRNRLCHHEPMWKDRKTRSRSHAFNNIRLKFSFLLSLLRSICEESYCMVLETRILGFEDPNELFTDESLFSKYYSRIDVLKRLRYGLLSMS